MTNKKSPFSKEFVETIKKQLLEEKEKMENELNKFSKRNAHVSDDFDTNFPDYGDKDDENAAEVADYITNKPLEESLEKNLRDITKTLERIDKGEYGICKYCGKTIEEKRLLARPASSACIECKKTITQEL